MPFYDKITNLDIENSSICNAACPQCVRETFPKNHSWFKQTYLPEEFFDRIPDHVYGQVENILFSGTMGDPCAAPNIIQVIKKVRQKNLKTQIKISTNGGMKSPKFWIELAEALGENAEVIFAIDGLRDTNHIYRINVNYDKLMENVSAFIGAGGKATWQFIAFNHNQHQIDQARQTSKTMGFVNFFVKPSHRFAIEIMQGKERIGGEGVIIKPPSNDALKHKVLFQPLKKLEPNEWMKKSENIPIDCYAQFEKSIYIDSQGNVFPCCFLGASLYSRITLEGINDGWDKLYTIHRQNLYNQTWDEIINSVFLNEIQNSWDGRTYEQGRLAVCAANCGDFEARVNDPKYYENSRNQAKKS